MDASDRVAIELHRADDPLRILSGLVGDTIAAELAGRKGGEVVPLKRGA